MFTAGHDKFFNIKCNTQHATYSSDMEVLRRDDVDELLSRLRNSDGVLSRSLLIPSVAI